MFRLSLRPITSVFPDTLSVSTYINIAARSVTSPSLYVLFFETMAIPSYTLSLRADTISLLPTKCDRTINYHITTDPSNKNAASSTVPNLATATNGVDISGFGNGAERFMFDTKIMSSPLHQLWQDPVIPKVIDHSNEFCLMDPNS